MAPVVPTSFDVSKWGATPDDALYRLIVGDINGIPLAELPAQNMQYSFILNSIGSLSFLLPTRHPKCTRDLLDLGKRTLFVYRGGLLVWGGYLWSAQTGSNNDTVQFGGEDWFSRILRRYLKVNKIYVNTDQLTIVRDLLSWMQSQPNGDMGIVQDNPTQTSGVLINQQWYNYERKNIGEAIQELSGALNGFDFVITPDKRWVFYYPSKGQATGIEFATGKNIRGYSVDYDAHNTNSELTGFGSGGGDKYGLISTQSDATALHDFGRLEATVTLDDARSQDMLDRKTQEELRTSKNILTRPQIEIQTDDPPFGSYSIGDEVLLTIQSGYDQLSQAMRITTITVSVANTGQEAIGVYFEEPVGA